MNYEIRQRIKSWAGAALAVAFWGGIIGGCTTLCYKDTVNNRESGIIINKVLKIAAGEDQIIDKEEKSMLLKELKMNTAIDESEAIRFFPYKSKSVSVYATSGDRTSRFLGELSRTNLQEYIVKHTEAVK